ncbi:MAG TPA: tetratricopeptide repeat protein [Steroidobacteraceae bacterium]|nr:tetratricopeptide repeat protein [Steroidobacteraceae bacterium]
MKGLEKRSARLLQAAIKAHQSGQLAKARDGYEAVLALRPADPDALHFFGVLHHNLGHSAEGAASIRRSLNVAPNNAHAWLNLGNILLEQEKSAEAKAAYERAAALAPDLADAWYNLGICLRKMEDAPAAIRALDRAIGVRSTHAPSHYQRGIAYRDASQLDAAEADFRRAVALKSDYVEVYESLGMLLYRQDRITDAAEVYKAWARIDPSSSTAAHLAAASSGDTIPERGSDAYVTETFDRFAATFDQNLANLGYRAPELVTAALRDAMGETPMLDCVLDAGCGTGLCGVLLRPLARRLVGVDLSSGMIEGARAKGHYDELAVSELVAFMRRHHAAFDAVVSADTFVYFGALEEGFAAAAQCLKSPGRLVLTLEQMADGAPGNYRLEPHGRYTHRLDYVRDALGSVGFEQIRSEEQVLRRERGADVRGLVIAAALTR